MIAVLLMLCVAAGIAYPFVQKTLALRRGEVLSGADGDATASSDAVVTPPIGVSRLAREELCPSCSRMNPPDAVKCVECGAMMPVSGISKLFGGVEQDNLIREGIQAGILLILMLIAMGIASFLPIGGKILLMLLTVGALGYRFSRVLYN